MHRPFKALWFLIALLIVRGSGSVTAQVTTLRVATYNVENYLLAPGETRRAKPVEARTKVVQILAALDADLIALQEVGGAAALTEIQQELKKHGRVYPWSNLVHAQDTNIMIAFLCRVPVISCIHHTNDIFALEGRPYKSGRGIAQLIIQPRTNLTVVVFNAHLKSRRETPDADQAQIRLGEARILRRKIDAVLANNPNAHVIVLGDLNDTKDSPPLKTILGRGKTRLVDLRPVEQSALASATNISSLRTETWTHFYAVQDLYSRVDYILCTPGLAARAVPDQCYVVDVPDWGLASDHRPVVATFKLD